MPPALRGTLQLDFDGTLAHGDVSTGILARFAGPEWQARVEAASRELTGNADSPALIDAMAAGFAALRGEPGDYLRYAREHHPARPGLSDLIDAAERLGLDCHVVSNGFEFYIRDYLQRAGVESRVAVQSGSLDAEGRLVYLGPAGQPANGRFKLAWAEHFLGRHELLVYAGDGASDIAPARLASIVFARDSLLTALSDCPRLKVRAFETLEDAARQLQSLRAATRPRAGASRPDPSSDSAYFRR
jgi:2-hydroxy-3-keto-5-methylthiopentenyl-1-phosphate phosphatase